jgi:hypothetical protein
MKVFRIAAPLLFCLLMSCSSNPVPHFTLVMTTTHGDTLLTYTLTDTSIMIQDTAPNYRSEWSTLFEPVKLNEERTLKQISTMKARSYDCSEQHALAVSRIRFTNDSGTVDINPNVNHPKEIDEAVRIFNHYGPENRRLLFEDMQQAIEPDGKLRI